MSAIRDLPAVRGICEEILCGCSITDMEGGNQTFAALAMNGSKAETGKLASGSKTMVLTRNRGHFLGEILVIIECPDCLSFIKIFWCPVFQIIGDSPF